MPHYKVHYRICTRDPVHIYEYMAHPGMFWDSCTRNAYVSEFVCRASTIVHVYHFLQFYKHLYGATKILLIKYFFFFFYFANIIYISGV